MDKIYNKFKKKPGVKDSIMKKLRDEAFEDSQEQRKFVLANQLLDFEELLVKCKKDNIFF